MHRTLIAALAACLFAASAFADDHIPEYECGETARTLVNPPWGDNCLLVCSAPTRAYSCPSNNFPYGCNEQGGYSVPPGDANDPDDPNDDYDWTSCGDPLSGYAGEKGRPAVPTPPITPIGPAAAAPDPVEPYMEPDTTYLLHWKGHPDGDMIDADYQWLIGNGDGVMTEECEPQTANDIDFGLWDCDGWQRIMDGDYVPTYLAVSTRARPKYSNWSGGPVLKCPNDLMDRAIRVTFGGSGSLTYPVVSSELLTVETAGGETHEACKLGLGEIQRQSANRNGRIIGARLGVYFPFVPEEAR